MFELADRLVGIYKTHNVTKSVTINPKECLQQQRQQQQRQGQQGEENGGAKARAALKVGKMLTIRHVVVEDCVE